MGAHLSEPVKEKVSETGRGGGRGRGHAWASSCMQGWRTGMEDSHITLSELGDDLQDIALFGVFDGHGGKEVALFVEKHLPVEIRKLLADGQQNRHDEVLTSAFHRMDELLREEPFKQELLEFKKSGARNADSTKGEEPQQSNQPRAQSFLQNSIQADLMDAKEKGSLSKEEATQVMMKMVLLKRLEAQRGGGAAQSSSETSCTADNVGCTAVCCLMTRDEVVCANAGDSRAVLCRKGRPVELSHDHKPNHITEKTRIEAAGGRVEEIAAGARTHYRVNGNLNLSRALGDLEYKKRSDLPHEKQMICSTPDIIRERLTPDDEFLVIACDGIWDVKSNEEVCDFVRSRLQEGIAREKIIEELLDECCTPDPKTTQGLGADNMTCVLVELLHAS